MPSMFSRRRGSVNRINSTPPSSSAAAIAASSAFLKNSASTTSLSSAAAAAALRSHTTSPEPIANIQTKRMQRRGSVSSIGSGSIMSARAGMTSPRPGMGMMERRGSQSSMTERTFRSPSPANTPSSKKARPVPAAADAPPLPKAPGRRSASVEPSMQRVTSPTPRAGRGVSVDRFAGRVTSLPKLPELEREGSQRSVNFSRPISPPPALPTTATSKSKAPSPRIISQAQSKGLPLTNGSARPHSSLGFTRNDVSGVKSDLRNVADKPIAKKKKTVTAKDGERLAAGTTVSGPTGAAVNGASSRPMSPPVINRNAAASPAPSVTTTPNRNSAASPAPSQTTTPTTKKKKPTAATVQADVQPPPKNPARALSPTPVKNALNKKPSVVREDPDAEASAESRAARVRPASAAGTRQTPETYARNINRPASAAGMRSSSMMHTSTGPALSSLAPDSPRVRAASLEVPRAHFSNVIVDANGVRHAPPPRSSSPFKSALKNSPSSSIRGYSPAGFNTSSRPPPSETSDTTSITSQDGVKPGKKKKNVRVSFDGDATDAGQETQRPSQPISFSPRRSLSPAFNDENDDKMQPRPALPTFGSVRSASSPARSQTMSSPPAAKTELPINGSASNDHAVGAVLANDHATKKAFAQDTDAPLPPQVTSVDGSGYDSEASHYSEDEEPAAAATAAATAAGSVLESTTAPPPVDPPSTTSDTTPAAMSTTTSTDTALKPIVADIMVPDISVLPATPGVEDVNGQPLEVAEQGKAYTVPGGWGDSETEQSAQHDVPPIVIDEEYHGNSPRLDVIEESEDDSDAFSDAAEDPAEFDGGFASLDAIVHSPISSATKPKRVVPDSPTAKVVQQTAEDETKETASGDWTQATAYWSSLSKQHKEQIEQQAAAKEETAVPVVEEAKPKKKPKAAVVTPSETASSPVPAARKPKAHVASQRAVETSTASQPTAMRKSMRDSQKGAPVPATAEQPTQMRKSMRGTESPRTSGSMRGSMRDGSGPSPRQRPVSMIQQGRPPPQQSPARPMSSGGLTAAAAPVRGPKAAPPAPSAYMKMPQDDSDSESSFKKKRRPSTSTIDSIGKVNMRRSMRAGSVDARPQSPANAPGSSKWSIRSSSPPTNPRTTMRQSLRRGSMDDVPTMRGKNSRAAARDSKSPSRFSVSSFRTSSKPALAPPPPSQPNASGFRSRFNDSDDEGEAAAPARGRTYTSRFADSDDEADSPTVPTRVTQTDYTPVRGIPRRAGQDDDDSTDLDDSDDNAPARRKPANKRVSKTPVVPSQSDIDKVMEQARRNVAAQTGNENVGMPVQTTPKKKVTLRSEPETEGPVTNGQLSPAGSDVNKRRGLLGSIFGRKRTMSSSTLPQTAAATSPPPQFTMPAGPATPTRGKLQRKGTGQLSRQGSSASGFPTLASTQNQTVSTPVQEKQNWPLPPTIPESEPKNARPKTSDGTVNMPRTLRDRAPRPQMNRRSYSAASDTKADDAVYSERTGKKKRFGKLRKAFGLND